MAASPIGSYIREYFCAKAAIRFRVARSQSMTRQAWEEHRSHLGPDPPTVTVR